MAPSPDSGPLDSAAWQRLQDIADRFEESWKDADTADLGKFLPPPDDPLRGAVLAELVKSELEIRCRRGQPIRLEDYLRRFPELTGTPGLLPRLLSEEYRVRQMYGDRPPLDSYRERFPTHFAEFERLATGLSIKAPSQSRHLPFGGGYTLIKRIGSGGFGEVWLAEAPGGIKAAVKTLFRSSDHEEAQRETSALKLLMEMRHPFLLLTQAYWTSEDRTHIVMELADGSLRDRLKQCREAGQAGIPLPELLQYFREAAEALDFLHENHIQHRDIKPENILLLQRHAKVADFGLARTQESQRMVSASGSGTPFYMAPEVWRGKSSMHSDQYSLAVTYAELRLDRRPFSSRDLAQLMFDHMEAAPDLTPLPGAEQAVLRKALAKEPEQRYPSCTAFVQALAEATAGQRGRTDPDLAVTPAGVIPGGRPDSGEFGTIRPGVGGVSSVSGEATEELEEEPAAVASRYRQRVTRRVLWLTAAGFVACLGIALAVATWPWTPAPPKPRSWLPAGEGWEAVGDAGEESRGWFLPDRIARTVDGERVEFVCIRKRPGTNDPATFYMMENKVWVGLYRKFAPAPGEPGRERYPVLGIAVADADRFARWLGGRLPSVRQWNKAAGLDEDADPAAGPFRGPWDPRAPNQVAVGRREQPLEVGQATHDISRFGVRDMAGNGREWTRDLSGSAREVPLENPGKTDLVLLRGWSFTEDAPLRFADLRDVQEGMEYLPNPDAFDVGFRVVVELEL